MQKVKERLYSVRGKAKNHFLPWNDRRRGTSPRGTSGNTAKIFESAKWFNKLSQYGYLLGIPVMLDARIIVSMFGETDSPFYSDLQCGHGGHHLASAWKTNVLSKL